MDKWISNAFILLFILGGIQTFFPGLSVVMTSFVVATIFVLLTHFSK